LYHAAERIDTDTYRSGQFLDYLTEIFYFRYQLYMAGVLVRMADDVSDRLPQHKRNNIFFGKASCVLRNFSLTITLTPAVGLKTLASIQNAVSK